MSLPLLVRTSVLLDSGSHAYLMLIASHFQIQPHRVARASIYECGDGGNRDLLQCSKQRQEKVSVSQSLSCI